VTRVLRYDFCYPMLVEGDPEFALLLTRAFVKAGVPRPHLRCESDGLRAIAALRSTTPAAASPMEAPPSFVVLDHPLPGKTGLEILEWMQSDRTMAKLPVFMLSSSENPAHVTRAFELRARSYFLKPAESHELEAIVEGVLAYWYRRSLQ